jgi:hypothetical protein
MTTAQKKTGPTPDEATARARFTEYLASDDLVLANLEEDPEALISKGIGGTWVKAWVWVSDDEDDR